MSPGSFALACAVAAAFLGLIALGAALDGKVEGHARRVGAAGALGVVTLPVSLVEGPGTNVGLVVSSVGLMAALRGVTRLVGRGRRPWQAAAPGERRGNGRPVEELTTAELYRLWSTTYDDVHGAPDAVSLDRIGERRRRCLDELERRAPEVVAALLQSGATGMERRGGPREPGRDGPREQTR